MSTPLERANRATEYTKRLNEKTALQAEINRRRAELQAYQDGPPEEDPQQQQYEAALANLDGEEAEELEIRDKERQLKTLEREIDASQLQVYTDRLVAQLERSAQEGEMKRQESVDWLRSRVAWASTAILGAVVTLAASGKLSGVDGAALRAIWYSGIAVALAAAQRVLLILFYLAVTFIAFAANKSSRYAKAAPVVSGGMTASAWIPIGLLAAEVTFMAFAAWNLAIVLEQVVQQ